MKKKITLKPWVPMFLILLLSNAAGNAQIALPYFENFGGIPSDNAFPPVTGGAWTRNTTTISQPTYTTNQTTYNRTGNGDTKFIAYYHSMNDMFYFVGPFSLTAGTSYRTGILYKTDSYYGWGPLKLTYGTTAAVATHTNTIASLPRDITNTAYQLIKGEFIPAASGSYYIGISLSALVNPFYFSMDDFSMQVTPTCEQPTGISASNLTGSSATLSWSAPLPAPAAGYEYYISTTNTAPAAATTPTGTSTTTTANITGLSPVTTYYVWVRGKCAGASRSLWTAMPSFTTGIDCNAATTLSCGVPVTTPNLATTGGAYNFNLTNCFNTHGNEKLYKFTAATTGTYRMRVRGVYARPWGP